MMNLAKKKKQAVKRRIKAGMLLTTTFFCLASPFFTANRVFAEESSTPSISIEKPEGWKQGDTTVSIMVDSSQIEVAKIEAKAGQDADWQDVTDSKSITISGNQTVYVRVTDTEGNVYEQNRSIRCYDTEKPTLSASLTDGVLTIQGNDSNSGIASITVSGTTYTDLENGKLKVQLTQSDFTKKTIEITATDNAGNTSDKYTLQNPYYEWAVQQAQQQSASGDGLSTTSSTDTAETEVTSPLPQDAEASDPTDAKGTVDERTITGIEEELAQTGEDAETITQTAAEGTKEFYTISTKSGKIFYLIIDNSKSQDNVYFLTEVSEKDLMNFTLSDTVTLPDVDTVYAEPEAEETEAEPETEETVGEEPEEEEPEMPEDKSPAGSYILIGLAAAGFLGAAYYFKVYKPKQDGYDEDEYDEDEMEEEPAQPDDADEETLPDETAPGDVLEDGEE